MEKHIDVLGYLLAAMVFSVGFLGARVHASYEATEREVHEQSWRVRNALLRGEPIGPAELTATIAVARRTTDRVASLSRLVNYGLFGAMAVVYGAALKLLADGIEGPPEASLITTLVFLGGASVIVIGELDVRKVERDRKTSISESLVGWISGLADALAAKRWTDFGSRLAVLSETYPNWELITEFKAYLNLVEGRPHDGFVLLRTLAEEDDCLYLTPVIATACALADGDSAAGLQLLDDLVARKVPGRHLGSLRAALGLSWAHIAVMAEEQTAPDQFAVARGQAQEPGVTDIILPGGKEADAARVLDLQPAQISQTSDLIALSRAWMSGDDEQELRRLAVGTPLIAALDLVQGKALDAAHPISDLLGLKDSAALETFGLIFLAGGRTRDALRMIERSIRIMPGSYRTHWAMAVVCHRLGWHTAAEASLRKMDTLMPDTALLAITRMVFANPEELSGEDAVAGFFHRRISDVERLQLALLGIPAEGGFTTATMRDRFFRQFTADALAAVRQSTGSRILA